MNHPYISLLVTAWKFAGKERRQYILIYLMFILSNLVVALHPLLYGWYVDSLQLEGKDVLSYTWLFAGGYLGLKLIEWAFHGPARVMERKLAFHLSKNFLDELYYQILHLPIKWHKDNHSGATINKIQKAFGALKEFFQNGFVYVQVLGKFIFSLGAMCFFSPLFGFIGVLIGVFTVWVIFQFDKKFVVYLKQCNEKEHEVSSNLFDSLSNIITVVTLRLEKSMQSGLFQKVANVFPPFKKQITINEWKWFIASMLVASVYVIVVIGYVYQNYIPGQAFLIGGLVTLLAYVTQFTSVFYDVAAHYTRIVQFNTDVQAVASLSEIYIKNHRTDAVAVMPEIWKTIDMKKIHYSHGPFQRHNASGLTNLQIRINRGERIALIGASGSGKSTLLALLRGLYVPEAGSVLKVDENGECDFGMIANTVTLFPQEPEIFENTIKFNITLGLPFSDAEIAKACDAAHFTEVIKHLPQGLDSEIKEKGVNLSGGQKQRLALARGILAAKGSHIVCLDEPTSSVDPRTEMQIYKKMFETFSDKAVISSLHRLHLLSAFNYIYIMDKGKIIDEGSFDQLRNTSAIFNELWDHQKSKEIALAS